MEKNNTEITQTHITGQTKYKKDKKNTEGNKISNFDPLYLYERYFPLRKSIYNRYYGRFQLPEQREELSAQIDYEFLLLVHEYDMNRGVDFPYYIGRMLTFRIQHYIEKHDSIKNNEVYIEDSADEEQEKNKREIDKIVDVESETVLDIVDALNSVDYEIMQNEINALLIKGVLSEGKSIEEIAEELNITPKKLNKQFNELCEELRERALKDSNVEVTENDEQELIKKQIEEKQTPDINRKPIKTKK